jgi:uncharacterized protein YkwD
LVLSLTIILAGAPVAAQDSSPEAEPAATHFVYLPVIQANSGPALSPFAAEVVTLTNQQRAAAGCAPLAINSKLTTAAQLHSEDMALRDFFSHTGSNNSSLSSRVLAQGYTFSRIAENIAAGYTTPTSVINGWMNSSGHRANILNCNLRDIGVGYYFLANDTGSVNYRHYWTQDFGTP